MRSTLLASAFALWAWLFPANTLTLAQGTGTSGEVRGMVTDATGGTVAKATVEIEDAEKGIRRTAITGSDGDFQVTGLPPSTTFQFAVRARDNAGNVSAFSNTVSGTTKGPSCTSYPATPTGLQVTSVSSNSANLLWNAVMAPTGCSVIWGRKATGSTSCR